MSRKCDICDKGPTIAWNRKLLRGHVNPTTKKIVLPNLQKKTIDGEKMKVCTACLRTLKKKAAKISTPVKKVVKKVAKTISKK